MLSSSLLWSFSLSLLYIFLHLYCVCTAFKLCVIVYLMKLSPSSFCFSRLWLSITFTSFVFFASSFSFTPYFQILDLPPFTPSHFHLPFLSASMMHFCDNFYTFLLIATFPTSIFFIAIIIIMIIITTVPITPSIFFKYFIAFLPSSVPWCPMPHPQSSPLYSLHPLWGKQSSASGPHCCWSAQTKGQIYIKDMEIFPACFLLL